MVTIERAERLLESRRFDKAEEIVTKLLVSQPDDPKVLLLAARIAAENRRLEDAVELAAAIPPEARSLYASAVESSARWLTQLERWDEAETQWKRVLELDPESIEAHRKLADLMNRQGRRQASAAHVRYLCRLGAANDVELHSILSVPVAFYDQSQQDSNQRPIGDLGKARIAFAEADLDKAIQLMDQLAQSRPLTPGEQAFLGRVLAVKQAFERMPQWLAGCDSKAEAYNDFWFAIGLWMAWQGEHQRAVEALSQAIRIEPTDRTAYRRLAESLARLGDQTGSQWCLERARQLDEVFELAYQVGLDRGRDPTKIEKLADAIEKLDRPWEALAWRTIAAQQFTGQPTALQSADSQRRKLRTLMESPAAATAQTELHLPPSLRQSNGPPSSIDWIADLPRTSSRSAESTATVTPGTARFCDVAGDVGLDGRYLNASQATLDLFLLHTGIGGGVAVTDYDLDGNPDLYFSQAACDPNWDDLTRWNGTQPNLLYRNIGGRFVQTTAEAAADDRGYGHGVTSGDVNADGFPDLVIANIGHNTLLINNGDGTFRDASEWIRTDTAYWTTCVAIADLNSDGLPEVIETNYVDDPSVYRDPWSGRDPTDPNLPPRKMPRPSEYAAAPDRIFVNHGDGSARAQRLPRQSGSDYGSGLAVLVTDIDHQGGNDLFVANDMRPNQLWMPSRKSQDARGATKDAHRATQNANDMITLVDRAVIAGCAYSSRGNATACMGIASADFDGNHLIDFAVTNFYDEPMCFYQQTSPGVFTDSAARVNLFEIGYDVNSFGTQAIDYDNNSRVDLVVVNGHIYDSRNFGVPFQMPPQLIDGSGARFQSVDQVDDPSGYWTSPSLGRAVATLDWNRDGRTDLVITHLDRPHALIENRSEQTGNWIQLKLVGTQSERDAIGALIRVVTPTQTFFNTVNSGDGFECKNEAILSFGLGTIDHIERVEVQWPSGETQDYTDISINQRVLLVEGDSEPFSISKRTR